jgi:prophage regulatory protein
MRVLRKQSAAERIGLSVRQLDRLEGDGKFPRKVKVGETAAGWLEHELDAWIEARAAERDARPLKAA